MKMKKAMNRVKKTFRTFVVLTMAFLVATSTLATAFATYGQLVSYKPDDSQKVTVEHIWVDNNNQFTEGKTETNEDGSTTQLTNKPDGFEGTTPRPDEVKADVTAKVDGENVPFQEDKEGSKPVDKDVIVDNGHTAGAAAGKDDAASGVEKDPNPGYDDGFNKGYSDGYDSVNPPAEDTGNGETDGSDTEDSAPVDGETNGSDTEDGAPAGGETDGGETEGEPAGEPDDSTPAAGGDTSDAAGDDGDAEQPAGPLAQLDKDVQDAIESILHPKEEDANKVADNVNKITDELLDKENEDGTLVRNEGNVWTESKDYTVKVEDNKDGKPVTYEVDLSQDTKDKLAAAGYESVQLKITYEAMFAVADENDEKKFIDPYTGHLRDEKDPVVVICQYVSYDDGKTWTTVSTSNFKVKDENGNYVDYTYQKPTGEVDDDDNPIYADSTMTLDEFKNDLKYQHDVTDEEGNVIHGKGTSVSKEDKEARVDWIQDYEKNADKIYVRETTYTFLHVLKDPVEKTTDPKDDPTDPKDDPKDPEDPKDPKDDPKDEDPETPEEQLLPDEEVPLGSIEPEEEYLLSDDGVPLANVPKTGEASTTVWTMLSLLAAASLLGMTMLERKKDENT